jgi:hypothetical protein
MRDYLGHTFITTEESTPTNWPWATMGRSGEQFDIWQAVYGPVGEDGYPQPIFDKVTGEIDPQRGRVLARTLRSERFCSATGRSWARVGGQRFTSMSAPTTRTSSERRRLSHGGLSQATNNPPYDGEVTYGPRAEHCWNGDPNLPNAYSRLHYNTHVPAEDSRAHPEDRAQRSRSDQLALLSPPRQRRPA